VGVRSPIRLGLGARSQRVFHERDRGHGQEPDMYVERSGRLELAPRSLLEGEEAVLHVMGLWTEALRSTSCHHFRRKYPSCVWVGVGAPPRRLGGDAPSASEPSKPAGSVDR
jgi:hypothetical protein